MESQNQNTKNRNFIKKEGIFQGGVIESKSAITSLTIEFQISTDQFTKDFFLFVGGPSQNFREY